MEPPNCPVPLNLGPSSQSSPLYVYLVFLSVIYPIFLVACLWVFVYNRNTSVYLRKRPLRIIVFAVVGNIIPWFTFAVYDLVGPENVPCWLFKMLCYMTYVLLIVPTILKLAYYRNERSMARLLEFVQQMDRNDDLFKEFAKQEDMLRGEASWRTTWAHLTMTFCSRRAVTQLKRTKILNAKFCNSRAFVLLWFTLTASPFLLGFIVFVSSNPVNTNCYGCELEWEDCAFMLCAAPFSLVIGLSTLRSQTANNDPLRIVRECIGIWLLGATSMVGWILILVDPNELQKQNDMRWRILLCISSASAVYFQTVHQVVLSRSFKLRQELLSNNKFNYEERFQDIMNDKWAKAELKKHMRSELSAEILDFLEAVMKFKLDFASAAPMMRVIMAEEIIDTYIKRGARLEVNLSSTIRESTVTSVADAQLQVDPNVFDVAYNSVKESFLIDGFPRFLRYLKGSNPVFGHPHRIIFSSSPQGNA